MPDRSADSATQRLIVISDLHISALALDDFDAEIERKFVAFADNLSSGPGSTEFVINGDFLDFVQAPPVDAPGLSGLSSIEGQPLSFTEAQSTEKLYTIYDAHPRVFDALRRFLIANPANTITVMPGNHDPDLFWPNIQSSLTKRVAASCPDRFRFHLERGYQPAAFPGLWIEHGHQFDRINSFFVGQIERWSATSPPIARDSSGQERLLECLGTRFLMLFLNRLDRDYPYVDNVKPFSVFVRLFAASALVDGFAPLRVAIAMWRLLYFLARTGMTRPSDLLTAEDGPVDVNSAMADRLRAVNERFKTFQARVHWAGFKSNLPLSLVLDDPMQAEELMLFLSEHPDLLDGFDADDMGYLSADDDGTLSLARGYRINESKELIAGATAILRRNGVRLVIMGHTHESMDRPGGLPYLNTGSWTRYYQHTTTDRLRPWSTLKEAKNNQFPYALKFAVVQRGAVEHATLEEHR